MSWSHDAKKVNQGQFDDIWADVRLRTKPHETKVSVEVGTNAYGSLI